LTVIAPKIQKNRFLKLHITISILLSAGDVCCFKIAIIWALCYNMYVVLLKLPSVKVYQIYVSGFIRPTCIGVCNDRLLKCLVYVFSLFLEHFIEPYNISKQYVWHMDCLTHQNCSEKKSIT
jgi:hypothetical protein